jgi:hypothetical protein
MSLPPKRQTAHPINLKNALSPRTPAHQNRDEDGERYKPMRVDKKKSLSAQLTPRLMTHIKDEG